MSIDIMGELGTLLKEAGSSKDAKVSIINVSDTQLMFFLKNYEPEVWEEFKKWRFYMVYGEGAVSSSIEPEEPRGEVISNQCIIQVDKKEDDMI